jgi:ABC-type phosphate/phosphonate transport system permease subunit
MSAVVDLAGNAGRIVQLDAARRRAGYLRYAWIAIVVGWIVEAIVVGDTDWTRISAAAVASAARRFIDFDASILLPLWEPARETVLMATVATLLGARMATPVAWLGAHNISPLGRLTSITLAGC